MRTYLPYTSIAVGFLENLRRSGRSGKIVKIGLFLQFSEVILLEELSFTNSVSIAYSQTFRMTMSWQKVCCAAS